MQTLFNYYCVIKRHNKIKLSFRIFNIVLHACNLYVTVDIHISHMLKWHVFTSTLFEISVTGYWYNKIRQFKKTPYS